MGLIKSLFREWGAQALHREGVLVTLMEIMIIIMIMWELRLDQYPQAAIIQPMIKSWYLKLSKQDLVGWVTNY